MRLAVVGLGLIGGSFALAARRNRLFEQVVGVDADADHGHRAVRLGLVDELVADVPKNVDAVLLAVPSDHIVPWLLELRKHPAILFDVGSVKGALIDRLGDTGASNNPRYVPCHPIAGSEHSGPDAADVDLFTGCRVIVTALPQTQTAALDRVTGWWQALGAEVVSMTPQEHDRVFALTSHLPHLAAFAYMQRIESNHLAYAAGGFRDFSRIAASDPDMWVPILCLNRRAVLAELSNLQASLVELGEAIEQQDDAGLRRLLTLARARRREFEDGVR